MNERLTIIVPAYNVAKYLPACLDSMAAQPGNDFSVLVVDDGSPDSCGAIADEYAARDSRFRVLHQANAGVGAARNAGLEQARGEWIWFVDGDDMIASNAVSSVLSAATPELELVCFGFAWYRRTERPVPNVTPRILTADELAALRLRIIYPREDLPCGDMPVQSTSFCLYRRAFLLQNGLRFLTHIPSGQDQLFNQQALIRCMHAAYLNAKPYIYRRNEGSISIRFNPRIPEIRLTMLAAYTEQTRRSLPGQSIAEELLRCHAMSGMRQCLCLCFCHAHNPAPYRERRDRFLAQMAQPPIREAFQDLSVLHAGFADTLVYRWIQEKRFFWLNLLYRTYTWLRG